VQEGNEFANEGTSEANWKEAEGLLKASAFRLNNRRNTRSRIRGRQ